MSKAKLFVSIVLVIFCLITGAKSAPPINGTKSDVSLGPPDPTTTQPGQNESDPKSTASSTKPSSTTPVSAIDSTTTTTTTTSTKASDLSIGPNTRTLPSQASGDSNTSSDPLTKTTQVTEKGNQGGLRSATQSTQQTLGAINSTLGGTTSKDSEPFEEDNKKKPDNFDDDNELDDDDDVETDRDSVGGFIKQPGSTLELDGEDLELENQVTKVESSDGDGHGDANKIATSQSSSHFMTTIVILIILVAFLYIVYHNRQKIMAYVIEGRHRRPARRRTTNVSVDYKKLPTGEETLSQPDDGKGSKSYIY